jgi:ornithine cyclodeaminase
MKLRVLSGDEVRRAVSMAQAIEVVKPAFAQLSTGKVDVPVRTGLDVPEHNGVSFFMPAFLQESDQLGVKIASVFPENLKRSLPTIHALVAVIDSETGRPTAIMDGTYLTALRTGAATGAATDLLARSGAKSAAIIGAGGQARTQLEGVCEVRDIEEVRVYSLRPESTASFAEEMQDAGGRIPQSVRAVSSAREALRGADIICTVTTARAPVFEDADLEAGVHINAVGSFTSEMQEVPEETIRRGHVVVDSRAACWEEAGDLLIPLKKGLISEGHIYAELGEILAGVKAGRGSDDEVTIFKSVGNAVQDVAVATKALEEARKHDLGVELEI